MEDGIIGRRYARAFAETLEEAGASAKLQEVSDELAALAAALADKTSILRQTMRDPTFSIKDRAGVMEAIATEKNFAAETKRFLDLLVKQDRIRFLGAISDAFAVEVDQRIQQVRAHIVSARPLEGKMAQEIIAALEKRTGKRVIADVEVDPSVIGGVRAHMGGLVFDGTIRAQLDRMQRDLAGS